MYKKLRETHYSRLSPLKLWVMLVGEDRVLEKNTCQIITWLHIDYIRYKEICTLLRDMCHSRRHRVY